MWTIASVWLRNTLLNLVILVSVIMTLLLLPHATITSAALAPRHIDAFSWRVAIFSTVALCAVGASLFLWYSFPHFGAKPEPDGTKPRRNPRKDTTRKGHAYIIVCLWLFVSVWIAPVVYRLSVPGGMQFSRSANVAYTPLAAPPTVSGKLTMSRTGAALDGVWVLCKDNEAACKPAVSPNRNRLQEVWQTNKPRCSVPASLTSIFRFCQSDHNSYSDHWLIPANLTSRTQESSLLWLYEAFPYLCIVFCYAIWFAQKETSRSLLRVTSVLFPLCGGLFASVLLFGLQYLFFAVTFTVDQKLITALGITLLPSLLLAIPFISLELCTGLMGTLLGSAQREWVARLRAVSVQIGALWLTIFGLSLIGPYVIELLTHTVLLNYAVWGGWIVSTIVGVKLGSSRSTSGRLKEKKSPTSGLNWNLGELVVKIAPPIFMVGLFLLLATLVTKLLRGGNPDVNVESTARWAGLTVVLFFTGLLFSWRIDINEFSMNAFYRDRLARCYSGASNPDRQPNLFTGFDVRDGALRVSGLLPKGWRDLECGEQGKYQGPFPIFCTALNLTTGRELAYQERKAASFAITPLFSGYSTGWTDGMDSSMNYNGFISTTRHIKAPLGLTVASAVAISGAAASPNMGFHSSTAMAFLMTIF